MSRTPMELLHRDPNPHTQSHDDGTQDREQHNQSQSLRLHSVDHVDSMTGTAQLPLYGTVFLWTDGARLGCFRGVNKGSRVVTMPVEIGARKAIK